MNCKYLLVILSILNVLHAQDTKESLINREIDSSRLKRSNFKKSKDLYAKDYKFISFHNDTTYVDTTLSVKKEYKYNYLRKDNFELMQFANIGQTYNSLSLDLDVGSALPLFAAQARHFNYYKLEDISYYHVPTPVTELFYKTAFQQGQVLDAFFTINTSKQFNFSIAYKGLRSLGNYQNGLTSTGNFRVTTNYQTKNKRYRMRGHIVLQDLLNQENGGISDEDVPRFINGDEEFLDRSIFDPNLSDAENILVGKRFFLDQSYVLTKSTDSLSNSHLEVNNIMSFEDKYYQYYEGGITEDFFGPGFTSVVDDKVTTENFYTSLGLRYKSDLLGNIDFSVAYNDINYGYDRVVVLEDQTITNRIKSSFLSLKGGYLKNYGGFTVEGNGELNLSDEFSGYHINGEASYRLNKDLNLNGGINIGSRLPNLNHLLFQSDYVNYNWDNTSQFENVKTQQLFLEIESEKWFNATIDITNTDNYTYFNLESFDESIKVIKPTQSTETIQYLRVKLQKEFKFGKFALDNTVMYQNENSDALNVPEIITRNTFYYTDIIFKKSLTFQTGIIFNYFTEYSMNGYDPVLAEFYTQNTQSIGGFPRLDFFINAKVRQTRIFLKAEHFNSSFTGYDYFSAPNYPFRDFVVRFGLVWDFFL